MLARLLLWLALTAVMSSAQAKRDQFGYGPDTYDFDDSLVEQWKESEVTLPPYPKDPDLLPVVLAPGDTIRIFIDRASLSRGPDRVARFTLVVESPGGARNVFYDGIRCETREYKTYAIGTSEQTFTPIKEGKWQRIAQPALNAFRYQLFRNYVCDDRSSAYSPAEVLRQLTR